MTVSSILSTTSVMSEDCCDNVLGDPITFPVSKQEVPNRFVKAATTECLANPNDGLPNERHCKLYSRFCGCGMVITGNVMVDRLHKESSRNVVLDGESNSDLEPFRDWSNSIKKVGEGVKSIMQISHPGRQSPVAATGWFPSRKMTNNSTYPVAPTSGSEARMLLPGCLGRFLGSLLIKPARELQREELPKIVQQFAATAKLAEEAGFDGIEIHAAHGYLLSQFLSPSGNLRADDYGSDAIGRRKLLLEVIQEIRKVTTPKFIVGIKINCKDRRTEGKDREDECIDLICELCRTQRLDFIELSGGNFEDTAFLEQNDSNEGEDNTFFSSFAKQLSAQLPSTDPEETINKPIFILTGGFRTAKGMKAAIETNITDMIGLGRPLIMDPTFCDAILRNKKDRVSASFFLSFVFAKALLEPALNSLWYNRQLDRLSRGLDPDPSLSKFYALTVTFFRTYICDWGRKRQQYK